MFACACPPYWPWLADLGNLCSADLARRPPGERQALLPLLLLRSPLRLRDRRRGSLSLGPVPDATSILATSAVKSWCSNFCAGALRGLSLRVSEPLLATLLAALLDLG